MNVAANVAGMHYPLPDEEAIEAIRIELYDRGLAWALVGVRDRALDRYLAVEHPRPIEDYIRMEEAIARLRARDAAQRATDMTWEATRALVFERDGGRCHVCGEVIPWHHYECGHIIDRVAGGSDRLSNLVTMCALCNRLKPVHESRAEYIAWLEAGAWTSEL